MQDPCVVVGVTMVVMMRQGTSEQDVRRGHQRSGREGGSGRARRSLSRVERRGRLIFGFCGGVDVCSCDERGGGGERESDLMWLWLWLSGKSATGIWRQALAALDGGWPDRHGAGMGRGRGRPNDGMVL